MEMIINKETNPLLAKAMRDAQKYPAYANVGANVSNYNDGGTYGDGYSDANYGDQSYGEGPAG